MERKDKKYRRFIMSNFKSFLKNENAMGWVADIAIRYTCPIWQALLSELGILVGAIARSIRIVSGGK